MTQSPPIRLVDDDPDLLEAQAQALQIAGFRTEVFSDPAQALRGLGREWPGVVLSDVRMPGMDGFQLFERIHAMDPELPVILLTGHGDVPMAVAALKQGVYDFLTKPIGGGPLAAAVSRAAQARALVLENRALRNRPEQVAQTDIGLMGQSPVMVHLRDTLERVGQLGGDVLIVGPAGCGKRTAAHAIHRHSPRLGRPFTRIQCAALDEARFDAELLGSDNSNPRLPRQPGKLEKTHRGTLFLDEVDSLPPALQARLHTILDTKEVWPAGAAAPRPLDLRVIASTRADLAQMVEDGRFRADLYYLIAGVTLHMPALAQRRDDVSVLFQHFLVQACRRLGVPVTPLTGAVKARLAGYGWPGNLSELQHYAENHALGLSPFDGGDGADDGPGLSDLMADYEAELIRDALRRAGGNATQAMARLRLPRKTFYDKLTRHGIKPADYRSGEG